MMAAARVCVHHHRHPQRLINLLSMGVTGWESSDTRPRPTTRKSWRDRIFRENRGVFRER